MWRLHEQAYCLPSGHASLVGLSHGDNWWLQREKDNEGPASWPITDQQPIVIAVVCRLPLQHCNLLVLQKDPTFVLLKETFIKLWILPHLTFSFLFTLTLLQPCWWSTKVLLLTGSQLLLLSWKKHACKNDYLDRMLFPCIKAGGIKGGLHGHRLLWTQQSSYFSVSARVVDLPL